MKIYIEDEQSRNQRLSLESQNDFQIVMTWITKVLECVETNFDPDSETAANDEQFYLETWEQIGQHYH